MVRDRTDFEAHVRAWKAQEDERRRQDPEGYEAELAKYEADKRRLETEESWMRRGARLESSGIMCEIPDDIRPALIAGTLPASEPLTATQAWMADRDRHPWIVLGGSTGVGKTCAAADAIAAEGGVFKTADEVVAAFAAMFGAEAQERERILRARVLVIDDVGTELDRDRMLAALVTLLSKRASAMWTPTILTANMTANAFRERYKNERLMSRFAKSVKWVSLQCKTDLRRRNGK